MEIVKVKNGTLENYDDDTITSNNPNSTSVIYLTAAKLSQFRIADDKKTEQK